MTQPVMPCPARLAARSVTLAARHLGVTRPAARARVRAAATTAAARLQAAGHGAVPWLAAIINALPDEEQDTVMHPQPPDPAEETVIRAAAKQEARYINRAYRRETAGERIMIEAGPWSLLLLIAAVRLAATHPGMPAYERSILEAYADTWARVYAGTPVETVAADGTMPAAAASLDGLN